MKDIIYNLTDGTATLKLTQGQETVIDLSDLDKVKNHTWRAVKSRRRFYAATQINQRPVLLQNYLMERTGINHRDKNSLNNRRSNLRPATPAQSGQSCVNDRNHSSGYRGVTPHWRAGKWIARITIEGHKRLHLGVFDDAAEAALAYDRAAVKYHGEFACSNFPDKKHNNSKSHYDREISVTELGIPKYEAATDTCVAGVCVNGEGRSGTLEEMAPLLENISRLEGEKNENN